VILGPWVYIWAFYPEPLVYIYVFVPVPYYFDYCSFLVKFEVRKTDSPCSFFWQALWLARSHFTGQRSGLGS